MKASILIAARNRAEQLRISLQSIHAQRYEGVEVCVIDDSSSDDTQTVIREAREWGHWVLRDCMYEREGGYLRNPSKVWNRGHAFANSPVVIEQGAEVVHLTDCVTPLLNLCRTGQVAIARCYNGTVRDMARLKATVDTNAFIFPPDVVARVPRTDGSRWKVPRDPQCGVDVYTGSERQAPFMFLGAITQEDFHRVGKYDENRQTGNDQGLAETLIKHGIAFAFSGEAIAFHLKHGKT